MLCLNANRHRRVLNVIINTHHALLTDAEYDSMREFRAGSVAIKSGSQEDHRKWCVTNRDDGVYYSKGPLRVVQGVSAAKAALLADAGIGSISRLAKLSNDAIEKKAAKIQGISASGLSAMVADTKSKAVSKRAPPIKDLLDNDNLFRKKYGSEKDNFWRWPG